MMGHTQYKTFMQRSFALYLVLGLLAASMGCAGKGLVAEKYSSEFYRVPRLLPDEPMDRNPEFIIYGDNKPGARVKEKFLKRRSWLTWKMLIFPFYEVYWLSNGLVGGINRLRHTPDYGAQERRMVRDAIYAEAKRSNIDFIINMGDMVADGRMPSHWEGFLRENKIEQPLVSDFPFLPVVGNHERANDLTYGLPNYEVVFPYPQFYVLDFLDAALFIVDSDLILDQYQSINDDEQDALFEKWFVSGEESEQPAWLERELASRNQPFKIVVMHHPPISFARHHTDWTESSYGTDLQKKRQQLLKLFYEQGVQAVFCSHEHLYEHSILRYSSPVASLNGNAAEREIHFIVSGGAGTPLRSRSDAKKLKKFLQDYRAEGFNVLLVKQEEIYHYCLVDIAPDRVTIRVMEVTGSVADAKTNDATHPLRLVEEILIPKKIVTSNE
jgi:hypothetical protein